MPGTIFLVVGRVGAGKTTFARSFARERPALRLTPDEWMIAIFDVLVPGHEKRDAVEGLLIRTALDAIRLGLDVVLDFGLWSREERKALHWLATEAGGTARTIYLPVDPVTQWEHVQKRWAETPGETWEVSADDLRGWHDLFQEPDDDELAGRYTVALPEQHPDWGHWARTRWPTSAS
jgi:predicted kinase